MRTRLLALPTRCAAEVPAAMRAQVFEATTRLVDEALQEIADSPKGNGHDER